VKSLRGRGRIAYRAHHRRVKSRARERDTALCVLAHELQSPLTVIKGYADQLCWAHERGEPLQLDDALAAIRRQVERLRALVRDMLDQTAANLRQLRLEMSDVSLSELLDVLLTDLAVAQRREVLREVTPNLWVRGDRRRLEQVVRNLLENACKYSPADTPVRVTLAPRGAEVAMAITDQGEGIPAEELPRLFAPFYRTASARARQPRGGLGLGLALCRRLVAQHHGAIRVESTPGAGATFYVYLPRLERAG